MGFSRRSFLQSTGGVACSLAASPLVTPVTFASTPGDNRLVVIVLRGALDGLDTLTPLGDPRLTELRPRLSQTEHIDIADGFGLHPDLRGLLPMWRAGQLAFVQNTATPYRNRRSHFDGQDLLEAGVADVTSRVRASGWLNRLLSHIPDARPATTFTVGRDDMVIARGDHAVTSWAPETRVDLSAQAQGLLGRLYEKDPLFASAHATAMLLLEGENAPRLDADGGKLVSLLQTQMLRSDKASATQSIAKFAAAQLRGDTRIAAFSIGGFDTHRNQPAALRRGLRDIQAALLTLERDLGPVWDMTTVLCMTEFGRTAAENGSRGTDHGTGGVMIAAGGAVRGGQVFGGRVALAEGDLYKGRDLMPNRDIRSYAGWVLRDLFDVAPSTIARDVFPGVDMEADPRIIL